MEVWGLAALQCDRFDTAEEALLEALAHDSGSVRGAMGLQAMCEKLGRADEARQYRELARRFWRSAEVQTFDAEWASIRSRLSTAAATSATNTVPSPGAIGP
jgi:Flp pilus assembly protein TadD